MRSMLTLLLLLALARPAPSVFGGLGPLRDVHGLDERAGQRFPTATIAMRLVALIASLCALIVAPASAQTIGDLVNQVAQANIQAHIAALEGERNTLAQMTSAADYIADQLVGFGYSVQGDPIGGSENLIAEWTGTTNPDEIFLIGAHFDTVPGSPGADDNASGIAGMLEAARVLSAGEYESSLQFVAFAFEESGLLGSAQLAQAYQAAGENVSGMISVEMIGYTCPAPCQTPFFDALPCLNVGTPGVTAGDFIAAVANNTSASMLSSFVAAAQAYAPGLPTNTAAVAGTGTCFPNSRRSDHASFWDVGYPAMMLTDTANFRNPNYHQATDTLATLDLAFATDVTRAIVGQAATQAVFVPEPGGASMAVAGLSLLLILRRRQARCPSEGA
jgi:hypothetical protein